MPRALVTSVEVCVESIDQPTTRRLNGSLWRRCQRRHWRYLRPIPHHVKGLITAKFWYRYSFRCLTQEGHGHRNLLREHMAADQVPRHSGPSAPCVSTSLREP